MCLILSLYLCSLENSTLERSIHRIRLAIIAPWAWMFLRRNNHTAMFRYINTDIVFQEFPDEVTLAINISECPCRCPGCHSQFLWADRGMNWRLKHYLHWFMARKIQLLVWALWGAMPTLQPLIRLQNTSKTITRIWRLAGTLGAQLSLRSSTNSVSTISKWGLISAISVPSTLLAPISGCTAAVLMEALRISLLAFGNPMKTRTYKKVVFA